MRHVVGFVGSLDVNSPRDILLAIPSTHYMEYSPSKGVYTSRFYFTEVGKPSSIGNFFININYAVENLFNNQGRGGVIGANSLQGKNIFAKWILAVSQIVFD